MGCPLAELAQHIAPLLPLPLMPGKKVPQVLIIAPDFPSDFIEPTEMDTEVNISLLKAEGLKQIHDAYCSKKKPNFSPKLLTKGGLLKTDLIAKNI